MLYPTYVSHCTNQRLAILAAENRERELRLLDEIQLRGTAAGRESEAAGEQQHDLEGLVENFESDIDIDMDTTAAAGQGEGKPSSRSLGGESESESDERSERVVDLGQRGVDRQPESQTLLPTTSESFGDPTTVGDRDQRGTGSYTPSASNSSDGQRSSTGDHHQPGTGNDYYPRRGGSGERMEPTGPPGAGQQEQGQGQGQQQKHEGQETPAGGDGDGDEGSEQKRSGKRVRAAIGVVAAAAYYAVWVAVALVLG